MIEVGIYRRQSYHMKLNEISLGTLHEKLVTCTLGITYKFDGLNQLINFKKDYDTIQ